MVIDSAGNVDIAGTLTQSATMTADTNDFVIKNSLNQNQASPLTPTLNAFVVQNKTGNVVAYINSTGFMFITGSLTEQVLFD